MRKVLLFTGVVGVLACLALPSLAAAKGTYVCNGSVGEGPLPFQFTAGTIDANVIVPAGAICTLYLQTVTGNVIVQGTLGGFGNRFEKNVVIDDGSIFFPLCVSLLCGGMPPNHVAGNLSFTGGGRLILEAARIDGNVTINGASSAGLSYALFGGNVHIANSTDVILFDLGDNQSAGIGGNLILTGNTGLALVNVIVAGAVNCDGNDPVPTLTNVQADAFHGQCSPGL
jgi:hypothetical protein